MEVFHKVSTLYMKGRSSVLCLRDIAAVVTSELLRFDLNQVDGAIR